MIDLAELVGLSEEALEARAKDNPQWWQAVMLHLTQQIEADRQSCHLAYYAPANPMARPIHLSTAREVAIVGGNRSSKTDTMLAEFAIQLTGHVPLSLMPDYPREKLRPPIRARLVCNSLTDTLEPVIKPKLRWDTWNGVGDPTDGRGHWGWIPKHCLVGGTWEKAYSEKYRTLHVQVDSFWTGPHGEVNRMSGTSSCQFLSYDQDLSAFAGSSMHLVGHDELPPADIYRENRMRTLDVQGQILTAFTPPDEIGLSRGDVSWFHDEVYEAGLPGPHKHPSIDTFILHTEKNAILSAADINALFARMTDEQRLVRGYGQFIHLSGVIYKTFTDVGAWWCFKCQKRMAVPVGGTCYVCGSDTITEFGHVVEPFELPTSWPVVFVIDPHPRKPDAIGWFAVSPSDDLYMIGNIEQDGTAPDIAKAVREYEEAYRLHPVKRLMDPNIATETNDKMRRGWTIRDEYSAVGLRCDLAIDDMHVGIQNVEELLRPDPRTRRPRLALFRGRCGYAQQAMKRWAWDEWGRARDREPKERPRERFKDHCDLVRYFANDRPSFHGYTTSLLRHRPTGRGGRGY